MAKIIVQELNLSKIGQLRYLSDKFLRKSRTTKVHHLYKRNLSRLILEPTNVF